MEEEEKTVVYYPVKEVSTANLEEVWKMSHFDIDWDARSMMPGDLVQTKSGLYRCVNFGWKRLL